VGLLILVWAYYLLVETKTDLDVTSVFTFSLLIAVEYTAVFLLYAAWRCVSFKRGKALGAKDILMEVTGTMETAKALRERSAPAGGTTA